MFEAFVAIVVKCLRVIHLIFTMPGDDMGIGQHQGRFAEILVFFCIVGRKRKIYVKAIGQRRVAAP